MSEWRQVPLGDVLTLQRGFDITRATQKEGCIPVVSSSGINSYHNEAKVEGPGVVIGRKGSLGTCFYLDEPFWPHDTTLWVKDFKGNDPKFCYFLLQGMGLAQHDVGAANPTLNRNHVHLIPVTVPRPTEQRRIAGILGAYDDLIEVNRRRVAVLEDMARGLFEEWFVRLRFPGHESVPLHNTPDGPLPEGWSEQLLIEIASVNYGKNLPKSKLIQDGKYPVYGASKIIGMFDDFTHAGRVILVGCRGTVGQFQISKPYSFITNNSFSIEPVADVDFAWLYFALIKRGIAETISGSAQPQITLQGISRVCLTKPADALIKAFHKIVMPMLESIWIIEDANQRLAASRDLLLPRLMSGQLSLAEAQKELEIA